MAKPPPKPVTLRPLANSMPMSLLRAREAVMAEFRPMLNEHDLTEQQWRVLRVLMEHPEISVTELAREAVILPPSLSRILRGLTDRGLVRRKAERADQRRSRVMISAAGKKLFHKVAPSSASIYARLERRLGKRRLQELNKLLNAIEKDLLAPD
ncbi:MAG: homoprotocatechuate degradation operon regulator HpaR [Pseudomonadota bacterium]